MDPSELEKQSRRTQEAESYFLSDLNGYKAWWDQHLDELDIVRESMDMEKVMLHPDDLQADHTNLFDEMLEDTRREHGLDS